MAAYFFDLDGTLVAYHTSSWLPGVVDRLTDLSRAGHQLYIMTMRERDRDAGTAWSVEHTEVLLQTLPFAVSLLLNVASPRVLVDDTKPEAVLATTNNPTEWLAKIWAGIRVR